MAYNVRQNLTINAMIPTTNKLTNDFFLGFGLFVAKEENDIIQGCEKFGFCDKARLVTIGNLTGYAEGFLKLKNILQGLKLSV